MKQKMLPVSLVLLVVLCIAPSTLAETGSPTSVLNLGQDLGQRIEDAARMWASKLGNFIMPSTEQEGEEPKIFRNSDAATSYVSPEVGADSQSQDALDSENGDHAPPSGIHGAPDPWG